MKHEPDFSHTNVAGTHALNTGSAELARQASLRRLAILDTPASPRFDAVARAAAAIAGTPIALITLIDADRQWFRANVGMEGVAETPRALAFCDHTILGSAPLVVSNTANDPRFAAHPMVTGAPNIGFYAGVPVSDELGLNLGALCVVDQQPRCLVPAQIAALVALADVATQLIAEHARDNELRLLQVLAETIPTQMYVLQPQDQRFLYANRAGLKRVDADPAMARRLLRQVSLRDTQSWMPPAALGELVADVMAARTAETVLLVEQPDRDITDVKLRVMPLNHEGEPLVGVVVTDISAWKQAERAHAREIERWKLAVEESGNGVWEWQPQSGAAYYSHGWAALLGHGPEELDLHFAEWLRRIHPDDEREASAAMERCFTHSTGLYRAEFRMRHKDGSYLWIEHRGRVIDRNARGQPLRLVGVTSSNAERHAITESLAAMNACLEQRVQERTDELMRVNRDLRMFAAAAGHDLAAPLRAISGFAALLRVDHGTLLPKDGRDLLARLEDSGRRMHQLLDALKGFFRLSEARPLMEKIDMNALVQTTLDLLDTMIAGRPGLRIDVEQLPSAHGDVRLLQIVLTNLINNSLKFTGEQAQPEIHIGALERQGHTVYFVRDNGVGFDEAHASRLFQPLERLHPQSRFDGTGIGLATAARIIEHNGGRIWAEGKVGLGATFSFQLGPPPRPLTKHAS